MDCRKIISLKVTTGSYASFINRILALGRERVSSYVCVANVHMVVEAFRDREFAAVVDAADLVTPDGMPLAKAMFLLHGISQDRVAGMDLIPDLIAGAGREGVSLYFYGSTQSVLDAVLHRIARDHPEVTVAGAYSPPFRPLTAEEEAAVIKRINNSGAGIVLVALGCPKQERWMANVRGRVAAVMVGIGGALPVYAGLQRRAPEYLQRLSLEWFYRLCQEPRRLFYRYMVTNSTFMFLIAKELLRKATK